MWSSTCPWEDPFLKICSFSNRLCLPNSGIWSWTSAKWIFSVHANSECAAGKKGAAAVSTTGSGWVPVQGSKYAADLDCWIQSPDLKGPLLSNPYWSDRQEHSRKATQSKSYCKFCSIYQGRGSIKVSELESLRKFVMINPMTWNRYWNRISLRNVHRSQE